MVKRIQKSTTEEKRVTGAEDSIAFMYDGKAYLCNHKRPADAHLVGERVAKWKDFRRAQLEIEAELNARGVSIRVDELKKKHGTV